MYTKGGGTERRLGECLDLTPVVAAEATGDLDVAPEAPAGDGQPGQLRPRLLGLVVEVVPPAFGLEREAELVERFPPPLWRK
jgi:hypothetical protein